MSEQPHRWVIDAIDGAVVTVEVETGKTIQVPTWVLPRGVKEGQVLRVRHDRDPVGERSTLEIVIDRAGTAAAIAASKAQVEAMHDASVRRDPGGNIKL